MWTVSAGLTPVVFDGQGEAMPSWEHLEIDASGMEFGQLHKCLAGLRRTGWEIVPMEEAAQGLAGLRISLRRPVGHCGVSI
jgi:hypothetical protein